MTEDTAGEKGGDGSDGGREAGNGGETEAGNGPLVGEDDGTGVEGDGVPRVRLTYDRLSSAATAVVKTE